MLTATVVKPFYDTEAKAHRKEGQRFDLTEERAAQIERRLPGYVTTKAKARRRTKE